MQNSDKTQQKATRSILSTVPDLEEAGMQAAREDPVELLCSKTMGLATSSVESNADKSNELVSMVKEKPITKTAMDIVAAKVINQGPPESSLQGMFESAIQLQSVPLANDGAKTPMHKTNNSAAVNLTDTSNVDPTCATLALSGSMNKMQIVDFEESLPKKKHTPSNGKGKVPAKTKPLSGADRITLQRLKHYENFLWLEFYKVYSVGAATEDDSHTLPAFVDILGDAENGTNISDKSNVESEAKPLLQASSYDGATELPTIVIEPDFSNEDSDIEELTQNKDIGTDAKYSGERKNTKSNAEFKETDLVNKYCKDTDQRSFIVKHKVVAKHIKSPACCEKRCLFKIHIKL